MPEAKVVNTQVIATIEMPDGYRDSIYVSLEDWEADPKRAQALIEVEAEQRVAARKEALARTAEEAPVDKDDVSLLEMKRELLTEQLATVEKQIAASASKPVAAEEAALSEAPLEREVR